MTHRLCRAAFLLSLLVAVAAASPTHAQPATGNTRDTRAPQETRSDSGAPTPRTDADENFELNIVERRITRKDFEASISVETGDETARGLNLRVGVAVGASNIDVLLRNVRGHVHFRGSLEALLQRLNLRRVAPVDTTTTREPQTNDRSP